MEGYNCPIRYAGYFYDSETGEYYLSSRYYDSFTGRFTTEDDPSYGKDTDPASLNLYSYCENDPIQYSDPTGHIPTLTGMTSTQLNTYFHTTSGYAENNAIAQSYGYSSALAMVGAYATAESINSNHSSSSTTVTAQQVNNAINQGSTAIYYAVNGSSSSVQEAATLAIANNVVVPYTSGMTPQSPVPQQITALMPKTPTPGIPGTELSNATIGQMKQSMDFNSMRNTVLASNDGEVGRTSENAYWRFGVGYDDLQHLVLSMESRTDENGNRWVNSGDFVKVLQKMLKARGYLKSSVDGQFGEDTYNAVFNFQKDMKPYYDWLKPDGIVGNGTWAILWLPEPGSDRYNAMLDDQVWSPSFGQYRNEYDIIGAAGLNGYSQFKDISAKVTGSTQGAGNGRTYSDDVDFHEWLYDPETDSGKYSLTTEYELAKLTISWYQATNNRDRQDIGIILQVIQRNANIHNIEEIIKKYLTNSSKITPISEAIFAQIEGGESIESLNSQVSMYKDVEVEIRNLTKGNEKQIGKYEDVGGHHIHAKSAFKDNINYDPKEGWSISQEYMREMGWDHSKMTAKQRELFKELSDSGNPNILREHNRIAIEALKAGNVPESIARRLVAESLINLRQQGVRFPTRIPWYSPKAVLEENIVKEEVPFK